MKLLHFILAFFLINAPIYAMEEDEDKNEEIMRHARHAIRPVIYKTLEKYVAGSQNKTQEFGINCALFKIKLYSKDFINTLNEDIFRFLRDGTDPCYLGCTYSFGEGTETLRRARIFFDKQTNTIKMLTKEEAEIQNMLDDFIFIQLDVQSLSMMV